MIRRLTLPDFSGKRLPDAVFVELVDLIYGAVGPLWIMAASMAVVGSLIAVRTGDPALGGLAVAGVVVGLARVAVVVAYRRRTRDRETPRPVAKAWERRYGAWSLLFAVILGAFNARTVPEGELLDHMLITGLIFGYGSGLVSRQSVRPLICAASLLLSTVPTAAALAAEARVGDVDHRLAYLVQALLVVAFTAGGLQTMAAAYRTTAGQILTKLNFADLARQDALTGLPNRLQLRERFGEEMLGLGAGRLLALHYLDLDRFKPVNDRYGHPVGDALLQAVAGRLTHMLRASDTAARLGGDEFVIVQTGISHPDEARMLAMRVIRALGAPYRVGGHDVSIGVSIGIALAPIDGADHDVLAGRADAALYRAKSSGRGTIAFWREVQKTEAAAAVA
ncbi:MAG TPA: GGDEF domain-containing protein [Caulobacter sp.]|nr:GGDEF domain-containing protein [Caulobacter sp.]